MLRRWKPESKLRDVYRPDADTSPQEKERRVAGRRTTRFWQTEPGRPDAYRPDDESLRILEIYNMRNDAYVATPIVGTW
jgi:hypothetical protein